MSTRFYALATGQNQANLPPILTLAQKGDSVIWIQTPRARQACWSETASKVLESRGIQASPKEAIPIEDADVLSPPTLRGILLRDMRDPNHKPPFVFVLNGGQKHSVLGIDRASLDESFTIVYSDLTPARLHVLDPKDDAFRPRPLENCLTFEEWRTVNGLVLRQGAVQPRRIWPSPEVPLSSQEFASFVSDSGFQRLLFGLYADLEQEPATVNAIPKVPKTPEVESRWRTRAEGIFSALRIPPERREKYGSLDQPLFQIVAKFCWDEIVRACRTPAESRLTQIEIDRLRSEGWLTGTVNDGMVHRENRLQGRLGDFFEEAVACRVMQFLEQNRTYAAPVHGVWLKTELALSARPDEPFAQYDVAILLKNAILLHLECKCKDLESEKDNFSRLAKLQQAGGDAVSQIFCVPVFTALAGGKEFDNMHRLYDRAHQYAQMNRRFRVIAYTAPGQIPAYEHENSQRPVPSFEDTLKAILKPYAGL